MSQKFVPPLISCLLSTTVHVCGGLKPPKKQVLTKLQSQKVPPNKKKVVYNTPQGVPPLLRASFRQRALLASSPLSRSPTS